MTTEFARVQVPRYFMPVRDFRVYPGAYVPEINHVNEAQTREPRFYECSDYSLDLPAFSLFLLRSIEPGGLWDPCVKSDIYAIGN